MRYPYLNTLQTARDMVDSFGGYNHNLRIGAGEFYDMKNMTSEDYPVLSPRGGRGQVIEECNPQALLSHDALYYIAGIPRYRVAHGEIVTAGIFPVAEERKLQLTAHSTDERVTQCEVSVCGKNLLPPNIYLRDTWYVMEEDNTSTCYIGYYPAGTYTFSFELDAVCASGCIWTLKVRQYMTDEGYELVLSQGDRAQATTFTLEYGAFLLFMYTPIGSANLGAVMPMDSCKHFMLEYSDRMTEYEEPVEVKLTVPVNDIAEVALIRPYTTVFCRERNASVQVEGTWYSDDYELRSTSKTKAVSVALSGHKPRTILAMGAKIAVWPDKKWVNPYVQNSGLIDMGHDIEATWENKKIVSGTETVVLLTFVPCNADGKAYEIDYRQDAAPTSPNNGELWLDTSDTPHSLKQYAESSAQWVSIATTYIKISAGLELEEDIPFDIYFSQYDAVSISGLKGATLIDGETGSKIDDEYISGIDGTYVLWDCQPNYIVIVGQLEQSRTIKNKITVSRKAPEMDFIIECGNRLWGCRYGLNAKGEMVNEIYASKLGDFTNWECFMGISTDSYFVTCGEPGEFTGAIAYLGTPIFFKENCLIKVYGTMPSNYQLQVTACRGVQKGSHKSLCILNETLYYKSRNGVCAYDGSMPTEVSYALGNERYTDAAAGVYENRYYISMKNSAGQYAMFVYDAANRLWMKEDDTKATEFCYHDGDLYYIDGERGCIQSVLGKGKPEQGPIEWMVETGVLGTDSPDKKYISKIVVRMSMTVGAQVAFYIQYDSIGDWKPVGSVMGTSLRTFSLPIRPRRCDHLRLRICGIGEAKVFSISKTVEEGSDL